MRNCVSALDSYTLYVTNTHSIHYTARSLFNHSCRFSQQPYKVYSSKVTKLIAAIKSRELMTMAPLAVPTVSIVVGVSMVVGVSIVVGV